MVNYQKPYKSTKQIGLKPKPFVRKRGLGTQIVRNSYGSKAEWYSLANEIKKRDNYQCIQCKKKENPKIGFYLHVHHIVPLSHGGVTAKANLISLCEECHKRRHKHL